VSRATRSGEEDWALLGDPLDDPTRKVFEAEFPEIPTDRLCNIVVEFRTMRAQVRQRSRLPLGKIGKQIAALEREVGAMLDRLEMLPDEVDDAIPGRRLPLIRELRMYRDALWSAAPSPEPQETRALIAALKRRFDAASIPVEVGEASRFVRAVQIVLRALGDKQVETAMGLRSLVETVRYHLGQLGQK
jgi:hypothetical protein